MAGVNGGDYLYHQFTNTRKVVDYDLIAATQNNTSLMAVKDANHTLYIQKIVFSITTHAAHTITFKDGAGTPVPIAVHLGTAAEGAGDPAVVTWDFGPTGTALSAGTLLQFSQDAAGMAGRIHVEGYERLSSVIASSAAS
jgi:hypothetical protein